MVSRVCHGGELTQLSTETDLACRHPSHVHFQVIEVGAGLHTHERGQHLWVVPAGQLKYRASDLFANTGVISYSLNERLVQKEE